MNAEDFEELQELFEGGDMDEYRESLAAAEKAVLDFISRYDFSSCGNSIHYLLGALLHL